MNRKEIIFGVAAPVAIATAILLWALYCAAVIEPATLNLFLSSWSVWALHLAAALLVAGFIGCAGSLCAELKGIFQTRQQRMWALAAGLLAVALLLLPPRRSIIYWDEQIYQNIAQAINWTGKATFCHECNAENGELTVFSGGYNKEPNGFPYYLSWFFRFLGTSESTAFFANSCAYLLLVSAVVVLSALLFGSAESALLGGICVGATPLLLRWAGTSSAEVPSAAFAALSALTIVLHIRVRTFFSAAFAIGAIGWMIHLRPENFFFVAPLFLLLLIKRPDEILQPRLLWCLMFLSLIVAPLLMHLYVVRYESWGSTTIAKFSLGAFQHNLAINGPFLLKDDRFPAGVTCLALLGLFIRGKLTERLFLFAWFLWAWGLFLFFYAGSYDFGADARFSILFAAPAGMLAGRGLSSLLEYAGKRKALRAARPAILALLALHLLMFLALIRAVGFEAIDARLDADAALEMEKHLPPDSMVLSQVPSLWLVRGHNSALASLVTEDRHHVETDLYDRYNTNLFFHFGFWCNVPDPVQNRYCENVFKVFDTELVSQIQGRGNYRYALYRLKRKTAGGL